MGGTAFLLRAVCRPRFTPTRQFAAQELTAVTFRYESIHSAILAWSGSPLPIGPGAALGAGLVSVHLPAPAGTPAAAPTLETFQPWWPDPLGRSIPGRPGADQLWHACVTRSGPDALFGVSVYLFGPPADTDSCSLPTDAKGALMRHRRTIGLPGRLAVLAGFAAWALAGCGGDDLEKKSAAEVQQEAAAALKGAASVHMISNGTSDGKPAKLDMKIQGTASQGTLTIGEDSVEITKIGDDLYVKGTRQALARLGAPGAAQRLGEGKWIKLAKGSLTSLEGFTTDDLAAQLTKFESRLEPKVEQTTLDGKKVVLISQQNGSKLYVANTGTAYPLRAIMTKDDTGEIDFTEYGTKFDIAAPPDAVDLSALRAGEPEPLSNEEFAWLDKIGALREEVDRAFGAGREGLAQWNAAELARVMPECNSKLASTGPPSARMQPVHGLLVQACGEYDKGAECFATADRLWNQAPDTPKEEELNKAIECGYTAESSGRKLLSDAELEGFKLAAHG